MEEGSSHDVVRDSEADDDAVETMPLRVQFADNVEDKARAGDASTSLKDVAVPLQPVTSDDGYLTPTTRTSGDHADQSYLNLVDSPTDTAASFSTTGDHHNHAS